MKKALLLVLGAPVLVAALAALGMSAASDSYQFNRAFSGLQAHVLDRAFNTSSGHKHSGTDSAYVQAKIMPAVQTIASGNTIAADACGGVKRISSASAVTTDTTDTFTSTASVSVLPCSMYVTNTGSSAITLDVNAKTFLAGGSNVVLGSTDTVHVIGFAGLGWVQFGATGDN